MFKKILIANRGEIACRVMATAAKLGIRTVAVYSEADANARHVEMADEAVLIGPAEVSASYLKGDTLLEVARNTGAEAIHPGYGFLSENAGFAEKCADAGIVFIGPPADAIRAMGLKDAAKALMVKAGVPVVPGYHGEGQDPEMLAAEAEKIGYPVLIKAVAGGGGKGMRSVSSPKEFPAALASAQREGQSAFGDSRVLIEKFLTKPRHIEIQVFADSHGNAVHLFERDCSLQRRHQKVIEEAPAPDMPDSMREAMGAAAVAAAKAIGYVGAGTIEFIADVSEGLKEDAFYFMEMNTRLQVEHPVTEMITGQDLVEWQLKVAAGGKLPCTQQDLSISGHAFEVRLYAEDPANDFLPATGQLLRLRPPRESDGVRIDTGVREGDTVTPFYDPMIAKLIVWDKTRDMALQKLSAALDEYQVAGVATNLAFLGNIATHPAFAAKDLDTGFIDRFKTDLVPEPLTPTDKDMAIAVAHLLLEREKAHKAARSATNDPYSPWDDLTAWRPNDAGHDDFKFEINGMEVTTHIVYENGGYLIDLPTGVLPVQVERTADGGILADIAGHKLSAAAVTQGNKIIVMTTGRQVELMQIIDDFDDAGSESGAGAITAPMPGKLIQIFIDSGATVAKGDPLVVLEAMKMEHTLTAPRDGIIEDIFFEVGDQVDEGTVLVRFESEETS
ncbi:acetyl/propionyl/methylcrotonyl-CoA carboxylase subunit alpha [uncultured Sneathiella sp.]|uniref:acetyl/propionyl/methylcrotonyl-CoA carboxylase subunit alpha n=1 Tax=uncultured Sneathiella sp. TaxID=879315 RepID=UPI002594737B|nr:acetyl/propionyl/methylcrotonyl-CoA carboxylase subunit alpha [uncultured Sneathiella sp.]